MQHVDGDGMRRAVACATLASLCMISAWIVWVVWGIVILADSSAVRYDSTCRAREYWWWMCGLYAWTGVSIVHVLIQRCTPDPSCRRMQDAIMDGVSIYAAVLWAALSADCDAWLAEQATNPTVRPDRGLA
jgi:hypothetical protein